MAWEPDDVLRSLRRYLALTLESPPWKIRVERREVKDEHRPVAVITDGPITPVRARTALTQGNIEELMPVSLTLYPPLSESSTDAIRASRLEASKLKAQLRDLLMIGLRITTTEDGRTRHWAGPLRLPLWDYDGVPVTGEDKGGPEDPHDVLWIVDSSLNVNAIQDPEDVRRWTVVATFRVSVERPGRVPAADEIMDVKEIVGTFAGEP